MVPTELAMLSGSCRQENSAAQPGVPALSSEVLVIEGDVLFQQLYVALFGALGCRAICVRSNAQAMQQLQISTPELIVLELGWPVGSGLAAARCLRDLPGLRHTPMMLLGMSVTAADSLAIDRLGDAVFVAKPLDLERFSGLVRRSLGATA